MIGMIGVIGESFSLLFFCVLFVENEHCGILVWMVVMVARGFYIEQCILGL